MHLRVAMLIIVSGCATPATTARPAPEPRSAPGPVGLDAGVPDAGVPVVAVVVAAPAYLSVELQKCEAGKFLSLFEVMKTRPTGEISVRAPMWKRPTQLCTASEPPYCVRHFVLAASRMTDANEATLWHLDVIGEVAAGVPFACTGEHPPEQCPLPVDGRVYGLRGTLEGTGFLLRALCR